MCDLGCYLCDVLLVYSVVVPENVVTLCACDQSLVVM